MRFIKTGYKSTLTDGELIEQFRKEREDKIIGILFERYAHLVFGVCMKYLKDEDAAQDAAMEIFEKLSSDLIKHEVKYFKSWLYMVAKNHCLMIWRQKQSVNTKLRDYHKDENHYVEMQVDSHPEKMAMEKEVQFENLSAAISSLKEEQKICIELFYLKELSYQEIVELTGFTMLNVKSHIQNGKRNLKIFLLKSDEKRIA